MHTFVSVFLQKVHLHFERLDLDVSSRCSGESVVIKDGVTGDEIMRACGNALPSDVTSSKSSLLVVFKSDVLHKKNGFVISYTARKIVPGVYLKIPDV